MSDTRSWMFRLKHWWNRRSSKEKVRIELLTGMTGMLFGYLANISATGVSTPEKFWGNVLLWGLVGFAWFVLEIKWLWRKAIYGY